MPRRRWRARTVLLPGMLVFFAYGYDLYALQTVAPSLLDHPTWDVTPSTLPPGPLGQTASALAIPATASVRTWGPVPKFRRT